MIQLTKSAALAIVLLGATCSALAEDPPAQAPAAAAPAEAPLSSDQLLSLLAHSLQTRFNLVGELSVDFANPWTPPAKSAADWRIVIMEYPASAGASMVVRYRLFADSKPLDESTVILRASLWGDAWFAREPLSSGGSLDTATVEARRIDFFRMRDAIAAGSIDPDLILTRSIQAGAMITWRDMGHRPLVRKGDMVEVCVAAGLLKVTMKGQALQSGAMGDIVMVRNPESLKTVPALVVGESRVQVRL